MWRIQFRVKMPGTCILCFSPVKLEPLKAMVHIVNFKEMAPVLCFYIRTDVLEVQLIKLEFQKARLKNLSRPNITRERKK
jgi:hypothetical protein